MYVCKLLFNILAERKKRVCIDWDELREKYLASDRDLYEFSSEHTRNENNPAWITLQKRSYAEKWREARTESNHKQYVESNGKSQMIQDETHQTLVEARKSLISSDLTILRHVEIAGSFQAMYLELLPKIRRASKLIDWDGLAESDPRQFVATLKDFSTIMTSAVTIERQALSLSDIKIELISSSQSNIDITTRSEDLKEMDTVDLIAKYKTLCDQND